MKPIDFLRSEEFELKFGWLQKDWLGCADLENEIIVLNVLSMLTYTYVHEYIHATTGIEDERKVRKMTDKRIKRMNKAEIMELGKEIFLRMLAQHSNLAKKI